MSTFIFPAIIIGIVGYGFIKKVNVFDAFLKGAKQGALSCLNILPALIGLVVAVSMMKASGFLEFVSQLVSPVLSFLRFPPDVLPLALLKPVSGSGAIAMIKNIFESSGVDSPSGRLASVMLGSSETTFYAIAVYFGATKVKNIRYTVFAALVADVVGIVASVLLCNIFFK